MLGDLELILITVFVLYIYANVAKHLGRRRMTPRQPRPYTRASPKRGCIPTALPSGPGVRPHLHADDGIDEEEHGDEQTDVGQGLAGGGRR